MADRIITYTYAAANYDAYKIKNIPLSIKAMKKEEVLEYINVDTTLLDNYTLDRLVPIIRVVGVPNTIIVASSKGGQSGSPNFDDSKFNASSESIALTTAFGYTKVKGFAIYLNKTFAEKELIFQDYNSSSQVDKYYPIYVNDGNKHLLKKIRIINPDINDVEYPGYSGVVYNQNVNTKRKGSFVVMGNSFSGNTGNRVTDITVPTITDSDIIIDGIYIGLTRIDSSQAYVNIRAAIFVQFLGVSDLILEVTTLYSSFTNETSGVMGYNYSFGIPNQPPVEYTITVNFDTPMYLSTLTIKVGEITKNYIAGVNTTITANAGDKVTVFLSVTGQDSGNAQRMIDVTDDGSNFLYTAAAYSNLQSPPITLTSNITIDANVL